MRGKVLGSGLPLREKPSRVAIAFSFASCVPLRTFHGGKQRIIALPHPFTLIGGLSGTRWSGHTKLFVQTPVVLES